MLWTRFFGLFLLIICKLAAAPVLEYENQKIEKLCIILHSDRGILYNNLSLKSSLITKEGSLFSQSEFDTDLKNLSEKYDRIEPSIKFVDDLVELEIELWTMKSKKFSKISLSD